MFVSSLETFFMLRIVVCISFKAASVEQPRVRLADPSELTCDCVVFQSIRLECDPGQQYVTTQSIALRLGNPLY